MIAAPTPRAAYDSNWVLETTASSEEAKPPFVWLGAVTATAGPRELRSSERT